MDVCKCIAPSRQGGTLNSRRAASPLLRDPVTDSWPQCHELELSTAEDLPCRGGRCSLNLSKLKLGAPPIGVLWKHAGYSSRVARKKPFISLQNQKKHLEFAKAHQLKADNFWKKVIFSDESKFNIFGSDGRRTVWRKPNTALDPKNLHPTVKHGGGSVMVWGCMASNRVGNLVFIDGIIGHKLYIDILNNNLKETAKKLGLDRNFIFQQDNDPKHTARNVKMWCLFHCKQQLHTPTQSLDINVIENLWTTLETAVQKHQIRNNPFKASVTRRMG
ncbi:transposable element Tcb1 transposase [Trichonephila clavipes]|nr:transposable element Tcb1 transposase [Trichonephila clavipes]